MSATKYIQHVGSHPLVGRSIKAEGAHLVMSVGPGETFLVYDVTHLWYLRDDERELRMDTPPERPHDLTNVFLLDDSGVPSQIALDPPEAVALITNGGTWNWTLL